jgi:phosphoribosylamine--glycine ligase
MGDLGSLPAVALPSYFPVFPLSCSPRSSAGLACVGVVLASAGYPGPVTSGRTITGIERANAMDDVEVFHAGTAMQGGALVSAGGRVLTVTALGPTHAVARARAYEAVSCLSFEGMQFRRDIGASLP